MVWRRLVSFLLSTSISIIPLLVLVILAEFWEQTYDNELDRAYDQMLVDIRVREQLQRSFNILPREFQVCSPKVPPSDNLWDSFDNRVCALALDFCCLCACGRHSGGSERVIGEKGASDRLEHGRDQSGTAQCRTDLCRYQPNTIDQSNQFCSLQFRLDSTRDCMHMRGRICVSNGRGKRERRRPGCRFGFMRLSELASKIRRMRG